MHDHLRIVGGLYVGWAAVQAVGFVALSLVRTDLQPRGGLLFVAAGTTLLLLVAFAVVGAMLWRRDLRARTAAIVLAAIALVSFPVGTALGAYALWVFLRRMPGRARA